MGNQPSSATLSNSTTVSSIATASTSSKSSSNTSRVGKKKNVTFAESNEIIDGDIAISDHPDDDMAAVLSRLEQENQMLQERCDRLEAQAILVSVQQLDYLAQAIAWTLYLGTMACIVKAAFLLSAPLMNHRIFYLFRQFCWKITCDGSCKVMFHCYHEKLVLLVLDWCWTILKNVLGATMLILNHRRTHGLDLRRCHVFAVAIIMFARIKLCRERERMFVKQREQADNDNYNNYRSSAGEEDEVNCAQASPPTKATTHSSSSSSSEFQTEQVQIITEEAIWDANYEVSARFLYLSFLRLRGLWTKTAQYLSSRADFVPTAYVRELSKLQDQAPATPWKDIVRHRIVPASVLRILDVDPVPIASASIGQVHIARVKNSKRDGRLEEKVVIKVQHPFAKTLLLDDFRSLAWICRIWSLLEPEYKFFEILMNEWATEARKELDFLQEAQNLCDAQASLELYKKQKQPEPHHCFVTSTNAIPYDVEIPQPTLSLCTRKVLVMSYCEGMRIDKYFESQSCTSASHDVIVPREDVMESVAQTFAHFMYNGTIFNGDPHPGNLFIRPGIKQQKRVDGGSGNLRRGFTLVLLDWGLAKRLPPTKRTAFAQMAYAAATIDFGLLLDSFDLLGLKMKREDVHQDMDSIRFLLRELAPRIIARQRIKAKIRRNQEKMKSKKRGERVPMESKAYPGEFFFFVRVNELLHGLGSRLQVQMNYLNIIKPFAERALLQASAIHSAKESVRVDPLPVIDMDLNEKISVVLKGLEGSNQIAGAQVCVIDANGNALVDLVAGHKGGYLCQHPMRFDTLVLGFSCTKAVTASLAHIMVAEGYLTPDEPICGRLWPNFCPFEQPPPALLAALHDTLSSDEVAQRWEWKRKITLRHILTHSAGLWSAIPPRLTIQQLSSCEACVAAFEYDPMNPADTLLPNRPPGEKGEYHFLSFGWLVAGVLCGAYKERHNVTKCTFEDVYRAILVPKLSPVTLSSGFQPNGCDSASCDSLALVDIDSTRTGYILQVERSEDPGEVSSSYKEQSFYEPLLPTLKGCEFLIDPRIWNCKTAREAVCPAAGGRFSARGLANFYHDLGNKGILSRERVEWASSTHMVLENVLQGQTTMANNSSIRQDKKTMFGLGYQLMTLDSTDCETQPVAFGHAGVGGSIGFYHKPSGVSVAVMLNKADVDKEATKKIVTVIAEHLGWEG